MTALLFFLGHLQFSAACHAASYPSRVPLWLAALLLRWAFSLGLGVFWYRCPDSPLGFYLVPAQLPLPLLPLCRVRQHVCRQSAGLLLGLGWWGLCYVTWFSPMYHALPQGLRLEQPSQLQATLGFFRSPGVCPSASLVAWVGLQPFPFSGLLLLRLLAGVGGVSHPVSGCSSSGGVCLVYR